MKTQRNNWHWPVAKTLAAYWLLASALFLCAKRAHAAEAGVQAWAQRHGAPVTNNSASATALAVDGNGNVFVTGHSFSFASARDCVTIKYSSAGVPLWTNRYNGPGNSYDQANAVAVDTNGNIFVTGGSDGIGSSYDYATIKYSNVGVPLWTNRYNGSANSQDIAYALAVDANGDVIVAGSSFGNSSGADYATIKYSNAGTPLWTNRYNGPANDRDGAEALAVDKDGSVFVTGYSVGNGSQEDYATIKYSSGGVPLWTNRYNGPGNFLDGANALALDASGDVFVTGGSQDGTGPLSDVFIDYATIKYSSTGVPLWTNRYNGPGNNHDTATALAVDASGDVFVTGRSTGPGIVNEPSPYNYAPYLDYATIKYSNAGVPLWTNRYDGPGNNQDEAGALALDTGGNVFVTGASPSTSNYGSQDYATIKYSNTGVPLWTNRHNGLANKLDQANSLAVGPDGSVYVTGGSEKNPSGGGQYFEFATIKIVSVPLLAIQRSAADVIVSWPATFTNYSLQQDIAGIGTANWSNITATVQNDGTNQTLIVSPPTGNRFYRLFKP